MGQVLLLAIILLGTGLLMLAPLLSQVATMLQKGGNEREQRMKVYAAEAAANRVIADLIRGADAVGTTYNTTQPHKAGGPYQSFTITTTYAIPTVTVNDYAPSLAISLATETQAKPATQQNYVDPGITHPLLATVPPGYGYLMRLYNVKGGTLQVNWAYAPGGKSRVGVWAGLPVDKHTDLPYPPGQVAEWPRESPILDTSKDAPDSVYNRTDAIAVDPATDGSGGVYTVVFYNKDNSATLTTAPFASSGGTSDTWIWVKAYKDYIVTASVGAISVSAYLRQVPGFTEPPAVVSQGGNNYSYTWATDNISFVTNEVYAYTWLSP
ncbi:MAG: hypothetical protein HYY01_05165 [Chloroflexi bacterium]|nr:hypothetical protein [Chloroflexota bacterium]